MRLRLINDLELFWRLEPANRVFKILPQPGVCPGAIEMATIADLSVHSGRALSLRAVLRLRQ